MSDTIAMWTLHALYTQQLLTKKPTDCIPDYIHTDIASVPAAKWNVAPTVCPLVENIGSLLHSWVPTHSPLYTVWHASHRDIILVGVYTNLINCWLELLFRGISKLGTVPWTVHVRNHISSPSHKITGSPQMNYIHPLLECHSRRTIAKWQCLLGK